MICQYVCLCSKFWIFIGGWLRCCRWSSVVSSNSLPLTGSRIECLLGCLVTISCSHNAESFKFSGRSLMYTWNLEEKRKHFASNFLYQSIDSLFCMLIYDALTDTSWVFSQYSFPRLSRSHMFETISLDYHQWHLGFFSDTPLLGCCCNRQSEREAHRSEASAARWTKMCDMWPLWRVHMWSDGWWCLQLGVQTNPITQGR